MMLLEKYDHRLNYSVFECLLSDSEVGQVKEKLARIIKPSLDVVLFYPLCKECVDKRTSIKGKEEQTPVVKVL
jgi:CRISPR-associated protein Cas2